MTVSMGLMGPVCGSFVPLQRISLIKLGIIPHEEHRPYHEAEGDEGGAKRASP